MHVDGNNFISHYIKNNKSFAAGKIGGTELKLIHTYMTGYGISEDLRQEAENVSGLVPTNQETLKWFSETFIECLERLDLLAKWSKIIPQLETELIEKKSKAYTTPLQHLEPYFFNDPWTNYLEGKKVLVFSPFAKSIEANFKNLDKIWNNKIKPNFSLHAVPYPTALTITEDSNFKDYKEIYDYHIDIINNVDFDIGIFGTGYTGLLFASECKKIGKSGIHMGGSTQILFGVLGNRWKQDKNFDSFINEHWTTPTKDETPARVDVVEEACYWG
jgi:hypothetical protein